MVPTLLIRMTRAREQLHYAAEALRQDDLEEAQVGVRAFLAEVQQAILTLDVGDQEKYVLAEMTAEAVRCERMLASQRIHP